MARWLVYSLLILAVVAAAIFIVFPQIRDSLLGFFERSEISLIRAEEKDVEFELDEQFPVEGVPSSFNPREHAVVKAEEPYPLFEGNQLMVEALLRQWLIVNLPSQPLCEFGWDGPCPVAQAVLLRKRQDGADTPFAALKKLLPPEDAQE